MTTPDRPAPPEPDSARVAAWLILGTLIAAVSAVVAFEWVRPDPPEVRIVEYDEATRRAPWLIGLYGSRGMKKEAAGELGQACADYTRVLEIYPGHPGTALARARAVVAGGANAPAAWRAQARDDLDAAERGYLLQRELCAAGAGPDGPSPAPATDRELQQIADLRQRLDALAGK